MTGLVLALPLICCVTLALGPEPLFPHLYNGANKPFSPRVVVRSSGDHRGVSRTTNNTEEVFREVRETLWNCRLLNAGKLHGAAQE